MASLEQDKESMLGQKAFFFNEEKMGSSLFNDIWNNLNNHRPWQGEICHRTETKKDLFYFYTLTPLKTVNPQGAEEIQYVSVAIDITRHVKAEALNKALMETDPLTQLPTLPAMESEARVGSPR